MLEVLLVLGMFAVFAGFGLLVSMETYRGSNFHADRALLVSLLERARAQSMSNMCACASCTDGAPHGVHIEASKYVLFEGASYSSTDPENASFDADPSSSHSFAGDILFTQLSGTTTGATVTLTGGAHTSDVLVSPEGRISWTN